MDRWLLVFVVLLDVLVHTSKGAVLLSNMSPLNDDLASLLSPASGMVKAVGFTMPSGSSYVLRSVTLRLGSYDAQDAPLVELRSNTGRLSPSETVLLTLRNQQSRGSEAANHIFLPAEGHLLTPGTTYWLCVSNPSGSLYWYASYNPSATKYGIASHAGDYTSQLEGDFLASSVTNSVEILADAVPPQDMTPSPSRPSSASASPVVSPSSSGLPSASPDHSASAFPSDSPPSSPSAFPSDSPPSSPSGSNNISSSSQVTSLANEPDGTAPAARTWLWAVLGCVAGVVAAGVGLWRWRVALWTRRSEAALDAFFDFKEVVVDHRFGVRLPAGLGSPLDAVDLELAS